MPSPPPPPNIKKEISILRSLISRTRRQVNDGTADPVQGGRLIVQSAIALSKLVLAQHHITPDPRSVIEQETAELREEIERIFGELGWNKHPSDYDTPPPPSTPGAPFKLVPYPPQTPTPKQKTQKRK